MSSLVLKKDNNLQNSNNYNKKLDKSVVDLFSHFVGIIQEYIVQFEDSIVIKNIEYKKFVIQNGAIVLFHVYKLLLMYTKNLKLTSHHCQKALYYYIEFIGQIGDDNHSFLKLNSKDASLFVYKKTIFDINNECKKEYDLDSNIEDKIKLNKLVKNVDIYIYLFNLIVSKHNYDENDKYSILKFTNGSLHEVAMALFELYLKNDELYNDRLENIELFSKKLMSMDDDNVNLLKKINMIVKFTKKIKNNILNQNVFNDKINSDKFVDHYKKYKTLKFINWCFSV